MPAWGTTCSHMLPGHSTHFCSSPAATFSPVGALGPYSPEDPCIWSPLLVWVIPTPSARATRPHNEQMGGWATQGAGQETGKREAKEEEQNSKMEGQGKHVSRSWR